LNHPLDHAVELRRLDYGLYLSSLFIPPAHRAAAQTVMHFYAQLRSLPFRIKEPLAGVIRLQWWREVLDAERGEEAASNPLAQDMLHVMASRGLSPQLFLTMLEGLTCDFYHDLFPDITALEAYAGNTDGMFLQALAGLLGSVNYSQTADAAGHGAVAMTLARLIRDFRFHLSRQQCFIPQSLLNEAELTSASLFAGHQEGRAKDLLQRLAKEGLKHFQIMKECEKKLSRDLVPALFPVYAISPVLEKALQKRYSPYSSSLALSPLRQWLRLLLK
jgi:phytoene synthase